MAKPESQDAQPKMPVDDDGQPLKFDAALEQLETIISGIETGEIGLEQALAEYEKGSVLIAHCKRILDRAEQQIKKLSVDGESADD